ncbi:MAG: class I SAM-dependent methyltransferase [Candidatus Limnocylindrales bacterium]
MLADKAGGFPEMVDVSRALLSMLVADAAVQHPTLLELGSGSGAMTVALLENGVAQADGVDLSSESVATARRRAEAAGVADRALFHVGDGSSFPVEPHDWVVLDRVMCCFPHVDRLLTHSIGAAQRRYAFSLPYARGWRRIVNGLLIGFDNSWDRLRGNGCTGYVHSMSKIESRLREAGFSKKDDRMIGLWYAAVWDRAGA